ncbi:MAG: hypothetical protein KF870_06130 [Leadbetterella sp.]|nr:hypothetical protein [Leadbetterella sp.]
MRLTIITLWAILAPFSVCRAQKGTCVNLENVYLYSASKRTKIRPTRSITLIQYKKVDSTTIEIRESEGYIRALSDSTLLFENKSYNLKYYTVGSPYSTFSSYHYFYRDNLTEYPLKDIVALRHSPGSRALEYVSTFLTGIGASGVFGSTPVAAFTENSKVRSAFRKTFFISAGTFAVGATLYLLSEKRFVYSLNDQEADFLSEYLQVKPKSIKKGVKLKRK